MFRGRKKELAKLEAEWAKRGFRIPVIYGRRLVGKSALLEQFAKNKKTLFFTPCIDQNENVRELLGIIKGINAEFGA